RDHSEFFTAQALAILCIFPCADDIDIHCISPFRVENKRSKLCLTNDAVDTNAQHLTEREASVATSNSEQLLIAQLNFAYRLLRDHSEFFTAQALAILCIFPCADDIDIHCISPFRVENKRSKLCLTNDAIDTNAQHLTERKASVATSNSEQLLIAQLNFAYRLLRDHGEFFTAQALAILCIFPCADDVDVHCVSPFRVENKRLKSSFPNGKRYLWQRSHFSSMLPHCSSVSYGHRTLLDRVAHSLQ